MSVEAFLDWVEQQDGKFELFRGRVIAMAGGTRRHARIAANIIGALDRKLAGSGCEVYGSDLALRTARDRIRFPDVAVYCDRTELDFDDDSQRLLERPCVVFEILSPSTAGQDRAIKLIEYRALPSVDTVVLVEPATRRLDVHQRHNETEWRSVTHLPGAGLTLRHPAISLTADEIFGPEEAGQGSVGDQ